MNDTVNNKFIYCYECYKNISTNISTMNMEAPVPVCSCARDHKDALSLFASRAFGDIKYHNL
jgi:hypothetical protein